MQTLAYYRDLHCSKSVQSDFMSSRVSEMLYENNTKVRETHTQTGYTETHKLLSWLSLIMFYKYTVTYAGD